MDDKDDKIKKDDLEEEKDLEKDLHTHKNYISEVPSSENNIIPPNELSEEELKQKYNAQLDKYSDNKPKQVMADEDKIIENSSSDKKEEKGRCMFDYYFSRFFSMSDSDKDPDERRFGGSNIRNYMCVVAILLIIFAGAGLVLFNGFGPDKLVGSDKSEEVMSVDTMKSSSTGATTCGFYDDQFGKSLIGKSVKLTNINVMNSGPGYITINSGNPSTYAFASLRDKNTNIQKGSKGTIYGVYQGYKKHEAEGINNPVPTFEEAIFEPAT